MKEKELNNKIVILERFNILIGKLKGYPETKTQKAIAEKLNMDPGNLSRAMKGDDGYFTESFLRKFAKVFKFNIDQLLETDDEINKRLGGKSIDENYSVNESPGNYPTRKTPFQELQQKWGKADNYMVPLYDDVSTFGSDVETEMEQVSQPTEYIKTGSWFGRTKITAAIRHYGYSMVEYPSGCILALKEIEDWMDNIVPGENYVIETNERRVTKKIQFKEGDDTVFMAYSTNRETHPDGTLVHQPFPIRKDKIRKVMLVVGRIVKEYSSGEVLTN